MLLFSSIYKYLLLGIWILVWSEWSDIQTHTHTCCLLSIDREMNMPHSDNMYKVLKWKCQNNELNSC